MKKKTFLVTGGAGFIGSHICKLLVQLNYKVIIFDNNFRSNTKNLSSITDKIIYIRGDIRDQNDLKKAFKFKIDSVMHLAYINGTINFYKKPILVLDVALKGLINIIDTSIKFKVKNMYLASSSEVYQTPSKIPTDEKEMLKIPDVFNPRYTYGGGKIISELIGVNYGKKYFKKLIIFRPHNVYGPNMGNEHVVPELINKFKNIKNNKIKIQGSGNEIRSFIYIDDFIKGIEILIKKGKHLNIYNIGTDKRTTIKQLVLVLANIFDKKVRIVKTKLRLGGTKKRLPDIKKIKSLGFKPKISLYEGLKKIIKNN